MITPTEEQLAVVEHPLEPLRVEAGAGTGKTATLALRIVHLVTALGIDPEAILGITFTNKAAAELADRIRTALAESSSLDPGREVEVHTYHGFATLLLKEYGALVGFERATGVITPTFSRQLIETVLATVDLPALNPANRGNVDDIRRLGSSLGDNLLEASDIEIPPLEEKSPWVLRSSLLTALEAYRIEKQRRGVVDYADLIMRAHQLVDQFPDIAAEFRSRYRAVMLDEYQDTNPAQRELLRKIFGDGFPIMAVGDIDQTIYEWRGASPHNFAQFPDHFPRPDGSPALTLPLTLNRRSLPAILAVANEVRRQTGSDQAPLRPIRGAIGGEVAVSWHGNAVTEAQDIARRINELKPAYAWKDMAILFRKNKDMILVHDALRAAEIPVEVANLGGLLAVPEVTDLHAWLRIIQVPEDSPALFRILLGPRFRLGMGDLAHLARWAKGQNRLAPDDDDAPQHTLLEAIDHVEELSQLRAGAREAVDRFSQEYRELLAVAQGSSLVELCRQVLDRTGAWHDLGAMAPSTQLSARLNLYRFLDLAEDWSPLEGSPSLPAFLSHLEAMAEERAEELDTARLSGEDAVTLVTVHRAKGLEWDVVFLPAVYRSNFPTSSRGFDNPLKSGRYLPFEYRLDRQWLPPIAPHRKDKENDDLLRSAHEDQEWRIAYVATTRPRQRLFVSGAFWYGGVEPRAREVKPSPLWELIAAQPGTRVDSSPGPVPPQPHVLRFEFDQPAPDPLFAGGWEAALRDEIASPSTEPETDVAGHIQTFRQMLLELPMPVAAEKDRLAETSVTGLVTYASCPKRFFWSEIDRLPRFGSPAARRGTTVHRAIELHNRGQVPLEDIDWEASDPLENHLGGESSFTRFRQSRFASVKPTLIEHPFEMTMGDVVIRGRVDAVYEEVGTEIVDFKTGSASTDPATNESRQVQLEAYAVAAVGEHFGRALSDPLRVSFAYFGSRPEIITYQCDDPWVDAARDRLLGLAAGISNENYSPTPSVACNSCDFLRFCPEGRSFMEKAL